MLLLWLDGQLGGGKEGGEAEWVLAVFAEGLVQNVVQVANVAGNPVDQVAVLGLVPDSFHGIEFGRVSREPFRSEPGAAASEQVSYGRAMRREAVAYEEQRPPQVVQSGGTEQYRRSGHYGRAVRSTSRSDSPTEHGRVRPRR